MRPPAEAPALARLAFEELADAVGGIGAVHRAISDRAFRHTGPAETSTTSPFSPSVSTS